MFINIRSLIPYISKECPLLIETPAGQGTEVLTTFDYFVSFYSEIFQNASFSGEFYII